jgi:Uma2 family endonuclease
VTSAHTRRWTRTEYDRLVDLGILHEDEAVELIGGRIILKGRHPVVERPWTAADYDRLVSAGLLRPEDRIELVTGALVCREPQGSYHATAVDLVADALAAAFDGGFVVRTEKPLRLDDQSEPEPDVAVVAGSRRDFRDAHPGHAVLVVEVADSSLDMDRRHKGSLYARSGIPEYWIVNLGDRSVEVHRAPEPDPAAVFGWRYARREVVGPEGAITPLTRAGARIAVADLLP